MVAYKNHYIYIHTHIYKIPIQVVSLIRDLLGFLSDSNTEPIYMYRLLLYSGLSATQAKQSKASLFLFAAKTIKAFAYVKQGPNQILL